MYWVSLNSVHQQKPLLPNTMKMQLGQENFINRFYGAFFKSDKQLNPKQP